MESVTPEENEQPSDDEDPDFIEGLGGWSKFCFTEDWKYALANLY